jgi:bacitracin synthase 1
MKTYPLLQSQLGIFYEWMKSPESVQYNLPFYAKLAPSINLDYIERSINKLLKERMETHIKFIMDNGIPRQYADMEMEIKVQRLQMENDREVMDFLNNKWIQPFNLLSGEPLWRFGLLETPHNKYVMINISHIVSDGTTCASVIFPDFCNIIANVDIQQPTYSLFDFAEQEQQSFLTPEYEKDRKYYLEKFKDADFITLASPNEMQNALGENICASSYISCRSVNDWCNQHSLKPSILFMAAFSLVLSRLSGKRDFAYANLFHGRTDKRLMRVYGMFIHPLPLLIHVDEDMTVSEFLLAQKDEFMSCFLHHLYPFTHFCADSSAVPRITYSFQGARVNEYCAGKFNLDWKHLYTGETNNDLGCMVYTAGDNYDIRMESSAALNSMETLRYVADAVHDCIITFMNNTECKMREVSIVSDEKKKALIQLGQGEVMPFDTTVTWIADFQKQVKRQPDALAVVDGNGSLTYAQLDRLSDMVAGQLIQDAKGTKAAVHSQQIVGILMERQKEFMVAALAAEKAGAAYVPLDSEYPLSRIAYMVEDSGCDTIITSYLLNANENKVEHVYYLQKKTKILYMESCIQSSVSEITPINKSNPELLSYIVYTSGSTGMPKGVMIQQKAKSNLINFIARRWKLHDTSRICCYSSFSFDASVEDLFPVLTVGGTVYIPDDVVRHNPQLIYRYICENHISGGCFTTSMGVMLANEYQLPMEYICLGGEKLQTNPHTDICVYNTYGPTEFTVDATYVELIHGKTYGEVPIGRPLYNQCAYVVDKTGQLLPRGVVGELALSGTQIAKGYLHQEEMTRSKFVDCPFLPGTRMYLTGDMTRWNDDGMLEYKGRTDTLVKMRGFRIELEEIERTALGMEGVRQAVAVVKKIGNMDYLCLYYTLKDNVNVTPEAMRAYIESSSLPYFAYPGRYERLSAMPLTPSGKIDRSAMPYIQVKMVNHRVPPKTEAEKCLYDILTNILESTDFGVTDDLKEQGLSSLGAMQLVVEANKKGIHIRVDNGSSKYSIRNMLKEQPEQIEQEQLTYWYHHTREDRPLVVVVLMMTNYTIMKPLLEALKKKDYQVLCLNLVLPVDSKMMDVSSMEEMTMLHHEALSRCIPADQKVDFILGHSMGGYMAYRLALLLHERQHNTPAVYLIDTYHPASIQFIISRWMDRTSRSHAEKYAILLDKTRKMLSWKDNMDIRPYPGEIVYFKAMKALNIENSDQVKDWMPDMSILKEAFNDLQTGKNAYLSWKKLNSQTEYIMMEADHYTILSEPLSDEIADRMAR